MALRFRVLASLLATAASLTVCTARCAAQDPARTATIYVGGFNNSGATQHGVFGVDRADSLIDSVAVLARQPRARGAASLPSNTIASAAYYGDTPPPYYTAADVAQLDQVTRLWGGGVPRYALIVAKYARDVMRRSGAQQVNFVSASFGSLIVRWLIEKDIEGLASQGTIARWLSIEGVLAGNWAASHDELVAIVNLFKPLSIDVFHMHYDWVSTFLHSPRTEADLAAYGGILIGQMVSTDDDAYDGALSAAMASYKEWQPNDGLQAVADARFGNVTARSRLDGLAPTLACFHNDHYGIQTSRSAWAQAAAFITQRRRVTVTMTSVQVTDLHEPHSWYFDLRPSEVVLETRVYSPAMATRWGLTDPVSVVEKEGGIAPLRLYNANGETQNVNQVIFDDLVLEEETQLRLALRAEEIDYDWRYGVTQEALPPSSYDDMGAGELVVSTRAPGTYTFRTGSWNGTIAVAVHEYPFTLPTEVTDVPVAAARPWLRIGPNPHGANVRIAVDGLVASAAPGTGTLEIFDCSGRRVRRIQGDARGGMVWDGRDEAGASLPAGLYVHRLATSIGTWEGKSVLVR